MNKNYVFAGASSAMAQKASKLLLAQGNTVIGISTKEKLLGYSSFYQIEKYETSCFPKIDSAIDGLVYFPGTINLKPFHRLAIADFMHDYEINTLGAVQFIQSYLPQIKQNTNASIVLLSSVAVQNGMTFHSSIAMAKGAIEGLTKSLAAELAPTIRVNAIAPSLTNTPLAERFTNTAEKLEASQKRNPMKKIGKPSEIAEAICFLLTDKSSWITGQIIAVDGGMGVLSV